MSIYYTICCNFRFIGMNHSPKFEGKCRQCDKIYVGEHGKNRMIITLSNEEIHPVGKEWKEARLSLLIRQLDKDNPTPVRSNLNENAETFHQNYIQYLETCWSTHYGVVLSPHVMWNLVLCELAGHIKENSDKYRSLFTDSNEKKEISVPTADPQLISLDLIMEQLEKLVPTDIKPFTPAFTTSTEMSVWANKAAFCDAVSPYYEYSMYLCAINKIRIDGSIEDWKKFESHLGQLSEILSGAQEYLFKVKKRVDIITQTLVDPDNSWKSLVDPDNSWKSLGVTYWKKMFYIEKCGSGHQEEVKGWINDFYMKKPNPSYTQNYSSTVSVVKYKEITTQKSYKLSYGLFESVLEADFLVPAFNYVIHEDAE